MVNGATMIKVVRDSKVYQQHKSVVVITNYSGRDNAHYVKRFDDNGNYIWSIDNLMNYPDFKEWLLWNRP